MQLTGDFTCHLDSRGLPPLQDGVLRHIQLRDAGGKLIGRLQGQEDRDGDMLVLDAVFGDCKLHWDGHARRITLRRNAIGRQTVHFHIQGSRILMSSRLPSLLAWQDQAKIDEVALTDFWHFGRVLAPRTIFHNIRHLRPGSTLTLSAVSDSWYMQETLHPWPEVAGLSWHGNGEADKQVPLAAFASDDRPELHPDGVILDKERECVFDEIAYITQILGQPAGEIGLALLSLLLRQRRTGLPAIVLDVHRGLSPRVMALRRHWMLNLLHTIERRRCEDIWHGERQSDLEHAAASAGILTESPAHERIDRMAAHLIQAERRLDLSTLARAAGQFVHFVPAFPSTTMRGEYPPRPFFPDDAQEARNLAYQAMALFHRRHVGEAAPLIARLKLNPFRLRTLLKTASEAEHFARNQSLMGILSLCHLVRFHRALPQPCPGWPEHDAHGPSANTTAR